MKVYRVIRVGYFAFEGIGRPYEGWRQNAWGGWVCAGRAFTRRGARRKALALDTGVVSGGFYDRSGNAASVQPRGHTIMASSPTT